MHKLTFCLATLVVVGGAGGALADSSDHGSNDSLKWEMREMQRMRQYSGVVPDSYPTDVPPDQIPFFCSL